MFLSGQRPELTDHEIDDLIHHVGEVIRTAATPVRCRDVFAMMAASVQEPELELSAIELSRLINRLGLEGINFPAHPSHPLGPFQDDGEGRRKIPVKNLEDEGEGRRGIRRSEAFIQLAEALPNPLLEVTQSDAQILANPGSQVAVAGLFRRFLASE